VIQVKSSPPGARWNAFPTSLKGAACNARINLKSSKDADYVRRA
jgi:hypothetical protein